ncbi:hypothetical protein OIU78_011977 [Salix suchowensis]|nr:hypothetical protein OIU78_011977 [Salix suchowensis]
MEERLIECRLKRDSFMQGLIEEQRRALESDCCGERKRNTIQVLLSLQETEPEYYTDDIIKGLLLGSSEECLVGRFCIPRGTMLFVNMWAIQNDPKIWLGPGKFKPERFDGLEGASDGLKLMPSGYGRRSCL